MGLFASNHQYDFCKPDLDLLTLQTDAFSTARSENGECVSSPGEIWLVNGSTLQQEGMNIEP